MLSGNSKSDRLVAFLAVCVIWAAVYLPALGTPELDGSEGRRILPALTMLETGNWIVPHMGGEPYYRKPPMINWLIATSFTLTGQRSEETARLCSALSLLAFVCLLCWLPGTWLSPAARLMGAVIVLTSIGLIAKGRRIEIDAIYTSMTLMAILCWLNTWARGGSWWMLWLVPSLFLASGILTKGPLILLLYYLTVICVLGYSKQMRALWSIPHVTAVALCLGLLLVWAWLSARQGGAEEMTAQTSLDLLLRLIPGHLDWLTWGRRVLGAALSFLPWLVVAPALWKREFLARLPEGQLPVFQGVRLSLCLGFGAIALMPGTKARYALPVVGLAGVLLGWLLSTIPALSDRARRWRVVVLGGFLISGAGGLAGIVLVDRGIHALIVALLALGLAMVVFQRREMIRTPLHLSLACGVLIAVFVLQYAVFVLPLAARRERFRPVAAQINALVPERETLHVFRPGAGTACQNLLFYLNPPLEYVTESRRIDSHVEYLLIQEADYEKLAGEAELVARLPMSLWSFTEDHHFRLRLLKLSTPPVAWRTRLALPLGRG